VFEVVRDRTIAACDQLWNTLTAQQLARIQLVSMNSRIQSIKSAARGFRNVENYRVRILFYCVKLDPMPDL
jgi:hypothetical protein